MIEYLIKKRKITLVIFTMLIMLGAFSFTSLPKQDQPDILIDKAIVTTIYPGAMPEKVEQTVTKKLEEKINEIQGIKEISSESKAGVSIITIKVKSNADQKKVFDELRKKVKDVETDLPEDAQQPVINDDLNRTFIQSFQITTGSFEELLQLRDTLDYWKEQLRVIPGVSNVEVKGLPDQEVKVFVNPQKLQQYGIVWAQVMDAVRTKNETSPLGDVNIDRKKYQLSLPMNHDVDQFSRVVVTHTQEGVPVYLKDIGSISLGFKDSEYLVFHKDKPAAVMSINAEVGSDIPKIHAEVEAKIKDLEKKLPTWAKKEIIFAQVDQIDSTFNGLSHELISAIAAVLIICTLGLNMTTSIMIAMAIPISMAIGMLFLPVFGITLNQITISALTIVLGILVDDAVVVNDNIERRLSLLGEEPYTASVQGTKEVSISILTATLATISAFFPLIFLPGIIGQYIVPLPVLTTVTMLASMAMSLTIVPIFRHWHEKKKQNGKKTDYRKSAGLFGKQIELLINWYGEKLMPKILNKPLKAGLIGIIIGTFFFGLIPLTPVQLFPYDDRPYMVVDVKLPSGSSIEETALVSRGIANWISKQQLINQVFTFAGGEAPRMFSGLPDLGTSENVGQLVINYDSKKMQAENVVDPWMTELKKLYPKASLSPHVLKLGPPTGSPVAIRVYGEDLQKLYPISEQIKKIVSDTRGTYDVKDSLGNEQYSLQFQVSQNLLDDKHITESDLSRTLRLVSKGIPVGHFDNGKDLIDITLYADKMGSSTEQILKQLTVPDAKGQLIPISQIAEIKPSFSLQTIPHHNLARVVMITSEIKDRTATDVMNELKKKMENIPFNDGYFWEVTGEVEEQAEIFSDLGYLGIIIVCLILILITMQFNSLSTPILIMSTLYLAVSGSMIGLFLTQKPLGFMAILGIISLSGLVVRNGIVLIEFIEEARHAGLPIKEAVIAAGKARLRPILLTTFVAVGGLIPMATIGSPLFKPMAITIIFGLLFSTMLTLIVLPSMYVVLATRLRKMEA
ncbi:efflux RND transporter permease subunit [Brevibacillus laterosporus]|uniref:efflux RND transporter permease subunit n=1 Tax=Brevibacillus laterosporus TaxID=1465 RepID=UPI0026550EE2|nr:efflux RND transporter permease subunit [Brevibacillus laterosporus]MDN9012712.1 efflux RND transporter permease subunit [Brevibacillus laterosporus]MDO0943801.1 efflux RND transporter permease subunit [Brevibacillus laterosporus]